MWSSPSSSDAALRNLSLWCIGCGLGFIFCHARFGFTASWRQLVEAGQALAIQAQCLMFAVAAVGFSLLMAADPAAYAGWASPIDVRLIFGATMFGVGMQLSGVCASGTLYSIGLGDVDAIFALVVGWMLGSAAAVASFAVWLPGGMGSYVFHEAVDFNRELGFFGGTALTLFLCAAAALLAELQMRLRTPPPLAPMRSAVGFWARLVRGAWPKWAAALGLAVGNVLIMLTSGSPWSVTSAFRLWVSLMMQGLGAPVSAWPYWQQRAPDSLRAAPLATVLEDKTTITDVGIIVGSMLAATAAGSLNTTLAHARLWPNIGCSILGGGLMGYGAAISYGCNIGALFGGIASGSLHGWVWGLCALLGTYPGLRLRRCVGLPVAQPHKPAGANGSML